MKTDCAVPGCRKDAVFWPYANFPNVCFCERHAARLIRKTVESILDGTHPYLMEENHAESETDKAVR